MINEIEKNMTQLEMAVGGCPDKFFTLFAGSMAEVSLAERYLPGQGQDLAGRLMAAFNRHADLIRVKRELAEKSVSSCQQQLKGI